MVSNVKLSTSLMTKQPQITNVVLSSLNLNAQAEDIAALLPPKVVDLTLDNGLFSAFPANLDKFNSTLTALYVHTRQMRDAPGVVASDSRRHFANRSFKNNYLTKIEPTPGLESLKTLYVPSHNSSTVSPRVSIRSLTLPGSHLTGR